MKTIALTAIANIIHSPTANLLNLKLLTKGLLILGPINALYPAFNTKLKGMLKGKKKHGLRIQSKHQN